MNLVEKDLKYIWHPYTHQKGMLPPLAITKGKGTLLFDEDGNSYIDAISSWWVNIHGHAHPYIAKQLYKQAKLLEQVIFAGFTHQPAVDLAEKLLSVLPVQFAKIFYSDNGSTATEVAIKMALQYWNNKEAFKRNKVLALSHSYHGDTFGAMSASSRSLFTKAFDDKLFEVIFIDPPNANNLEATLDKILEHKGEIACFIYEPLLQGAGGMGMYDKEDLDTLIGLLKEQNVICIADEVLTGFYRTGKFFASEYMLNQPDIICLSKALTGGTMALGVTACTQEIYEAFVSDDKTKTFFHGHSFTANPLACTAALASLELINKDSCVKSVDRIVSSHKEFLDRLREKKWKVPIKNLRQCGTIVAFEIIEEGDDYLSNINAKFTPFCLKRGVYLRSLGNTIYIMPPYCIKKKELKKVYKVIEAFLSE